MSHTGLGYDYCTQSVNLHHYVLNLVRVAMWQETGGKLYQDLHKQYSPLKQRANRLLVEAATEVGRTQGEAMICRRKMLCTKEKEAVNYGDIQLLMAVAEAGMV
jgi:hypothetical protein